jgi:hypothetical protein
MVWPYNASLHFMQDQCLRLDGGPVPNLRRLFEVYHENLTGKLPWWRDEVAPRIRLRAHMWEGFEIFVGLDPRLRSMPNCTDGMILVGDAAGLESTELCDGVPAAWFSADIAADVAIEALRAGDTSASFLSRYDRRIKEHPIIQWSISGRNRYDLRRAQETHDLKLLKKLVHNGWGLGGFTHMSTPLLQAVLDAVRDDPTVPVKWVKMYLRYFYNWRHGRFDGSASRGQGDAARTGPAARRHPSEAVVRSAFNGAEAALRTLRPVVRPLAGMLRPLTVMANPLMKILLPVVEPVYRRMLKVTEPLMEPVSRKLVAWVEQCDPSIFASGGE